MLSSLEPFEQLESLSIGTNLLSKSRLDPGVALLDLTRLHLKLRDPFEGEGWPLEVCTLADLEYRRFLTLKRLFFSTPIVPNRLIDKFWHAHILDTRNYQADCLQLFGEFFHHYPYFGLRGESDLNDLCRAFKATQMLYLKIFNVSMNEAPSKAAKILSQYKPTQDPLFGDPAFLTY